uniref:Uncharacterized protein n=1 Tax=Chlamydomonas euryale TaxID=1486919 RepID=A0A7R9VZA4_9CHLO
MDGGGAAACDAGGDPAAAMAADDVELVPEAARELQGASPLLGKAASVSPATALASAASELSSPSSPGGGGDGDDALLLAGGCSELLGSHCCWPTDDLSEHAALLSDLGCAPALGDPFELMVL